MNINKQYNNISFRRNFRPIPQEIVRERAKKISELLNRALEQNINVTLNALAQESGYKIDVVRHIIDQNTDLRTIYDNIKATFRKNADIVHNAVVSASLFGTSNISNPQINNEIDDYSRIFTKELNSIHIDIDTIMNTFERFPILVDDIVSHRFSDGSRRFANKTNITDLEEAYSKNPDLTLDLMHEENEKGQQKFISGQIKQIVDIVNDSPELLEDLQNNYQFVTSLCSQSDINGRPCHGIEDIKNLSKIYLESKHKKYIEDLLSRKNFDEQYLYTAKDILYIEKELSSNNAKFINMLVNYFDKKNYVYFKGSDIIKILESLKKAKNNKLQKLLTNETILKMKSSEGEPTLSITKKIVKIFEASTKSNIDYFSDLVELLSFENGFKLYSLTRGSITKKEYQELAHKKILKKDWTYSEDGVFGYFYKKVPLISKNDLEKLKEIVK